MSRSELLSVGPQAISPQLQSDGLPSFGLQRGYIDRALKGGRPVFEWLHCDADGNEIPCEVRFIRLPSSARKLVRASIIDIAARRRADTFAFGERSILELIAADAPLERTLLGDRRARRANAVPTFCAVVMLLDEQRTVIDAGRGRGLKGALREAPIELPVGLRAGACGAAASAALGNLVADIQPIRCVGATRRGRGRGGVRAVAHADRDDRRPCPRHARELFRVGRGPKTEELDLAARLTQLAGIAIRRKQDENALRVASRASAHCSTTS